MSRSNCVVFLLSPVSSSGLPLTFSGRPSGRQDCIQSLWGPWTSKTPEQAEGNDSARYSHNLKEEERNSRRKFIILSGGLDAYFFNRSCWFGRETQTVLHWHLRGILQQRGENIHHVYTHLLQTLTSICEKHTFRRRHAPERLRWNLVRVQSWQWAGVRGDLWQTASETWLRAAGRQRRC